MSKSSQKIIATLVALSQISFALPAFASSSTDSASPELSLLAQVLTLQGEKLSQSDLQAQVSAAVGDYARTAPVTGRADRLEKALVDMKVYTPEQAHEFVRDAQATEANAISKSKTGTQAAEVISDEVVGLSKLHPMGAQYANCSASDAGQAVFGIGLASVTVGAIVRFAHPGCNYSCSSDYNLGNDLMIFGGIAAGVGAIVWASSGC